jgi:putative addiction module killer protein
MVEAREYEVVEYVTETGKCPFRAWLDRLGDKRVKARVDARLLGIRLGNFGDAKPIVGGKGVKELRVNFGPGYRIYFGVDGNHLIVLLVGGDKRSQVSDIRKAKQYWQQYTAG